MLYFYSLTFSQISMHILNLELIKIISTKVIHVNTGVLHQKNADATQIERHFTAAWALNVTIIIRYGPIYDSVARLFLEKNIDFHYFL